MSILKADPDWFKKAIYYEVYVRSFYDSNGDGYGDFAGLTEKLPYLQKLGIDCIWLLPFYQSPLKDGGYDISDYRKVLPQFGTMDDFQTFLDTSHKLGIRVIADLVINHTSDQHPWFQESRKPGSAKRDYYMWSDTDTKYKDARIIFTDTEKSNWTWDETAQAYYWHRFFSHQPDLNYDCPAVQEEMLSAVNFWLERGLDGFRLDAVPYLYAREGTNCENLPETHGFLKRLRKEVDAKFTGKVLLAEANQWPKDVVDYFGENGDECQMAFHFPIMPRMYMSAKMEDARPMIEILKQTPAIPKNCAWGIFLRNHDELTLEMVTDDERAFMYDQFAKNPRQRLNVGIRRRLAPLLDNSRPLSELLHGMLLSLPGAPILYYGDEIGMGDNVWLEDRDGVRTPMQWSSDRNAGFSRCDPGQLYLPLIQDPVYGFERTNVEGAELDKSSLLHWIRALIAVRRANPALSTGEFQLVETRNHAIFAYLRTLGDETILCVNNVSARPQAVEIELPGYEGVTPVSLIGDTRFPSIGKQAYPLTFGANGFYWLKLTKDASGTRPA